MSETVERWIRELRRVAELTPFSSLTVVSARQMIEYFTKYPDADVRIAKLQAERAALVKAQVLNHEEHLVIQKAWAHRATWRDQPESYWLNGLTEEYLELHLALDGKHKHTPSEELIQIAAICLNWLDMRALAAVRVDSITKEQHESK